MNKRATEIVSKRNKKLSIQVIPGHFATSHSHVNFYLDMTSIKSMHKTARLAAQELAGSYMGTAIDTIVCLDGTRIVGAFLADELSLASVAGINEGTSLAVITPEINPNNQMLFRDNVQSMVWGKRVLLLVASVTTGKTVKRALECIRYYGGQAVGVGALFSAVPEAGEVPVNALFTLEDVPGYITYAYHDCPDCKEGRKIDAIINSYGYSKI